MAITLHPTTKHPSTVLMPPEDKYSKPPLRDEIKKEIQNTDRGGKPGERSARKVLSTTAPPDALILPSVISDTRAPSNEDIRIQKAQRRLQHHKKQEGQI